METPFGDTFDSLKKLKVVDEDAQDVPDLEMSI
jgi:hypothetical protein